jgi:2-keto-4-pentenoate hydratase/2-oxohepta-3-ene-1,7-dioic acid hydratase in catechol pathway
MTQWVRFRSAEGRVGFGRLELDQIREHAGDLFGASSATGKTYPLAAVTLLAPVVPSKIVALWNNFHALAKKIDKPIPKYPLFFIKPTSCTIGPGEPIRRPPAYAGKIVYEGELGVVIGKRCANVSIEDAAAHVLGYTCVNDVTAIDLLYEEPNFAQWTRAKSCDTFGCLGPAITSDFDWQSCHVITRLDGVERQNYPLKDMVFSPLELVSRVSHDLSLMPGDVIACGTSLGVGSIKDGVTVEVSIDGIGVLVNTLARGN